MSVGYPAARPVFPLCSRENTRLLTIDKRDIYRHARLWGLCERSENREKTTDVLLRYFVGICLVNLRLLRRSPSGWPPVFRPPDLRVPPRPDP